MIICDKLKKLFHKEKKSNLPNNYWDEPIKYIEVSFNEIKKDVVVANKKMDENIAKLKRKLPELTKERLQIELKAVRKSMNAKEYGMVKTLFPQDFYRLMDGHLKSYRDEIEKELKRRSTMKQ